VTTVITDLASLCYGILLWKNIYKFSSFIHSCIGDLINDRYETAKIKCGVRGLFSLEPCYTLWPVGIDKPLPIYTYELAMLQCCRILMS
jgi:hypothetical protein